MAPVFGLDIGGSGIKGAPVDLDLGELAAERVRLVTPPGCPRRRRRRDRRAGRRQLRLHRASSAPRFPAVIVDGRRAHREPTSTTAWIDTDVAATLSASTGCHVVAVNDADAAGLAEMRFGVGRDVKGTVALLTFGTGIGSALFLDGKLSRTPNSAISNSTDTTPRPRPPTRPANAKTSPGSTGRTRVSRYLQHFEALLWPDLIILGGGVSKKADKFLPLIADVRTKVVTAQLQNEAGIIGAALYAAELYPAERTATG